MAIAARQSTPQAAPGLEPPKFTVVDAAMTLLALGSVSLVLLDIFARGRIYAWGLFTPIVVVDAVITAIFLLDFLWKAKQAGSIGRAIRENWFDVLGLIPMVAFVALEARVAGVPFDDAFFARVHLTGAAGAGGVLRLFRFVRIVRVGAALSRFLRATNMTFGEAVTKRVFDKYRRIIVAEMTTPILTAGITMSQEIIVRMKFLESVGKALDAQRPAIHKAVIEALEKNKVPQNVLTQPFVEKIVNQVEETVVNTVVDTLTGPELNALTQKMIVEILENFKQQLNSAEGKAALVGMSTGPGPAAAAASAAPAAPAAPPPVRSLAPSPPPTTPTSKK